MKKYLKEIVFSGIFLILFFVIAMFVFNMWSATFDSDIFKWVASIRNDFWTGFFNLITFFGGKIFTIILVVVGIAILINRDKSTYKNFVKNNKANDLLNRFMPWLIFGISVLFVTILFLIFKEIFARERPMAWSIIEESGWSFPSGHTSTSMAMYGVLCLLINKSIDKKWLKILNITVFSIFIFLIAISRVYLGVHYVTDILAGACIGAIVVCIASILVKMTGTKIQYRSDL